MPKIETESARGSVREKGTSLEEMPLCLPPLTTGMTSLWPLQVPLTGPQTILGMMSRTVIHSIHTITTRAVLHHCTPRAPFIQGIIGIPTNQTIL